ncbi:hypothetical protein [Limnofasciculus baicalensis]|uniref:Uncharacterized protein n=1 Tax=Limnofasciculus baicalensis BBK-W-15 TaxID=2699891 RepID=A0AAE3GS76_9CYAN|nr:hypothetical protein [Limnofasciculus baicalensis]MCP2728868.1 hypothetical protein [Limnofasciculus baicalensis BBK-W-15]
MKPYNKSNGLTTSAQVTASLEPAPISKLNLSESDLVEIYHSAPKILSHKALTVSVTEDTLSSEESIVIEAAKNGNYWLIATEDDIYWLFPQANVKINPYIDESVKLLFNCNGYQTDAPSQFTLNMPAKLAIMPRGEEWQLVEKGILDFSGNSSLGEIEAEEGEYQEIQDQLTHTTLQKHTRLENQSALVLAKRGEALTKIEGKLPIELEQKFVEIQAQLDRSNLEREQLKHQLEEVYQKRYLLQSKISELQTLLPEVQTDPDETAKQTPPVIDTTIIEELILRSRLQPPPIELCLVIVLLRNPIPVKPQKKPASPKKSSPKITIGIIVAILSLTSVGLYAASPYINNLCPNIGNCDSYKQTLNQAQAAYDAAVAIKGTTLPELDSKRRLIENAIALINNIPKTARIQDKATQLILTCKKELETDARILKGEGEIIALQASQYQNTAIQPANIGKLTSTIEDLQRSQELWKQATIKLNGISPKIDIYPTIQASVTNYQKQIAQVEENLAKKREARRLLDEAAKSASQGESLTKTAQTIPQLKEAKSQWEETLASINKLPLDAIDTAQIEALKKNYNGQLKLVTNEITAQLLLEEATSLAAQANALTNKAQNIRELRRAQGRWQLALSKLNQIALDTPTFKRIGSLKQEYGQQVRILDNRIRSVTPR